MQETILEMLVLQTEVDTVGLLHNMVVTIQVDKGRATMKMIKAQVPVSLILALKLLGLTKSSIFS